MSQQDQEERHRQQEAEHRQILKELFQSKEWEHLKREAEQVFRNCDNALHHINCDNVEWYRGGCAKIRELIDLERGYK